MKTRLHFEFSKSILILLLLIFYCSSIDAQTLLLPNPLVCNDGSFVSDSEMWYKKRKPELLELFEINIYGKYPGNPDSISSSIVSTKNILSGKAIMNQLQLKVFVKGKFIILNLLEIKPSIIKKPVACFVGLNFDGNQTVLSDTSIIITDKWLIDYKTPGVINNHATNASRGIDSSQWSIQMIVEHGYTLITCHCADIDEDRINYSDGIQTLFYQNEQNKPKNGQWATLATWAWGMSRIYDYIITNPDIDSKRVIAIGHSRMGKAALCSAAMDNRFAAVISNNSGCGGAAIFRNKEGERIADINRAFPYWFNEKFKEYNDNENALPVDQHELLALIAPRPIYVASATKDQWADPENEFLALTKVVPVYQLLGVKGIPVFTKPIENKPQLGILSYHLRNGNHDITPWDWQQYLYFADRFVK